MVSDDRDEQGIKQLKMLKRPSKKEEAELKKKVRSRFDGRWVIVILFTLTVMVSLFFYLRTEFPRWLENLFTPRVVISKPPQ